MIRAVAVAGLIFAWSAVAASADSTAPLFLEAKIALGAVGGRLDHLAIDLARRRLFVAELGNDSVAVVDLARRSTIHVIGGLSEPQGVGYIAQTDTIYVANGGDGSVRLFNGRDFSPVSRIALDRDADNIRTDEAMGLAYVGHGGGGIGALVGGGGGGIAIIGAAGHLVGDIKVLAHPEGFQIDAASHRLYVNLPDADRIGVIDLETKSLAFAWPLRAVHANFPMTLDRAHDRILIGVRSPPRLLAIAPTGTVAANAVSCDDADDIFADTRRSRVYVSCGEGVLDIFATDGGRLERIGRIATARGARTSLWVPALDRLFVAVRATASGSAAIWVFRPAP